MQTRKGRILTGHRPTGPRHIGHLVGTLDNWKRLQDTYTCFFLIADLHVLTTDYTKTDQIYENTIEMLIDWLASGIDPQKSTIVLQSSIPEHPQLCALLNMLVTVNRLQRVPTYKEQVKELNLKPSAGLLTYPVLQAADILLYNADVVPVGEDQLPHIELTKEIARRFNTLYGEILAEPEALLSDYPRLPGIDNRTMHTSYGNAIFLKDSTEVTHKKVMSMYTDPTRIHKTDPGHVEGNPVFTYLDVFDPDIDKAKELKSLYRGGNVGDVEVKNYLSEVVNTYLAPIRERRKQLSENKEKVIEIIKDGTEKARIEAKSQMQNIMHAFGFTIGN